MTLAGQEALSHYSRREIIVMLEPPVFVSIAARRNSKAKLKGTR